jgi:outer membrane protein OmpA-like peptidoglycan-associated protein
MNDARRVPALAALVVMLTAGLLSACGPQRIRTPDSPGQSLIVLLPDPAAGTPGLAAVSNASGTANLAHARDATQVSTNQPPGPVTIISEAELRRLFGDALSALPPPPQHFTLFFRFESDQPTEPSRAMVPEILEAVRTRPAPDVLVVGHTDTTGTPADNVELGFKRATMVRNLLVEAGLAASAIDVTSFGEADLLVSTADDTPEPRNRRVEITVR